MRISRHYADHHIGTEIFETRLAVYEDQVRGWFHDRGRILEKASNHAGFVLLMIAVSYIEGYAIFWKGEDGRGQSRDFFREAFREIFPLMDEDNEVRDEDLYVPTPYRGADRTILGLSSTVVQTSEVSWRELRLWD